MPAAEPCRPDDETVAMYALYSGQQAGHTVATIQRRLSGIRKRPGLKAKEHPADFDDLKRLSPKLYEWLPRVGLPAEDEYVKAFFDSLPVLEKERDDAPASEA